MTAGAPAEGASALDYRPDIDGLRAVAVVLILLYHAGWSAVPGGYVGVDVFFVISGFLITGLLARELGQSGTIDLRAFYARRARRILPASFLVLVVTLVACVVFFSPIGLWHAVRDIAASAAYVPNIVFARDTADYFHPARVSPVIHYWSLGVEEQFYVVWPAFLLVAHRLAARHGPRMSLLVALAVAVSVALSVVFTPGHANAAFYLLPTRAWELGAGALLAMGAPRLRAMPLAAAHLAGAAGLAMIAISAVAFGSSTSFPGVAALVPVVGSVLVIAGGTGAGGQGAGRAGAGGSWSARVLALPPLRYVGRISYSLYLWHWPVLVFGAIALQGVIPDGLQGAVAIGLTVPLAAITYRWVEDPLRRGRLIGRRPSRNLATALIASVLLVAVSLGGGLFAVRRFEPSAAAAAVPPSGDPLAGLIPATGPTQDGPLPVDATPSLLNLHAGTIIENPFTEACSLQTSGTVNGPCTFGDRASKTEVVLFGDSHVLQWWPAVESIARERDWKVVVLVKTSCTYADVTTVSVSGPKTVCDAWRSTALARIAADRPAMVIVSANHRAPPIVGGVVLAGGAATTAMQGAAARTLADLRATGASVVVIADTPQVPWDPADCLSRYADHVIRCALQRDVALDPAWLVAERAAATGAGATFVDAAAWACPSDPCPAIIGRYVVYADTNHLTRPFVAALTSRLDAALPR
ncbi:MAG TPA: acyltransferase family protein [Candidatus Dormibacteraeota bacterium]|nr:acyltransferase family protein [Candidatus Dormibacteraeota bacterium]